MLILASIQELERALPALFKKTTKKQTLLGIDGPPRLVLKNHYSNAYHHLLVLPLFLTSYKWNHTVYSFLWGFFCSI